MKTRQRQGKALQHARHIEEQQATIAMQKMRQEAQARIIQNQATPFLTSPYLLCLLCRALLASLVTECPLVCGLRRSTICVLITNKIS